MSNNAKQSLQGFSMIVSIVKQGYAGEEPFIAHISEVKCKARKVQCKARKMKCDFGQLKCKQRQLKGKFIQALDDEGILRVDKSTLGHTSKK